MLISTNLHKKSSQVSIKTRSSPDSFSFKGQATKHTTVKWSTQVLSSRNNYRYIELKIPGDHVQEIFLQR